MKLNKNDFCRFKFKFGRHVAKEYWRMIAIIQDCFAIVGLYERKFEDYMNTTTRKFSVILFRLRQRYKTNSYEL